MARREFLAAIGKAVGGSAMLRAMAAMGIGTSVSACGSSSAASAPGGPSPPAPRIDSPRPGDWPADIGAGKTVVILGAGIAGMTAALEMSRLGYACTILEARASAGGRVMTLRAGDAVNEIDSLQTCQFDVDDDLYFNAGPSRIAQHHEFLLGYCRDFGVKLETFTNDNRGAWLHSPGAFGGEPQRRSIRTRWTRR
jgi:monoamine oxidase